jgi:hypothetical protein
LPEFGEKESFQLRAVAIVWIGKPEVVFAGSTICVSELSLAGQIGDKSMELANALHADFWCPSTGVLPDDPGYPLISNKEGTLAVSDSTRA